MVAQGVCLWVAGVNWEVSAKIKIPKGSELCSCCCSWRVPLGLDGLRGENNGCVPGCRDAYALRFAGGDDGVADSSAHFELAGGIVRGRGRQRFGNWYTDGRRHSFERCEELQGVLLASSGLLLHHVK